MYFLVPLMLKLACTLIWPIEDRWGDISRGFKYASVTCLDLISSSIFHEKNM